MDHSVFVYGLQGALAIALIYALVIDVKRRLIPNWLNGVIAAAAPLFWVVNGYALWPDIAAQFACAMVVLFFFATFFAFGLMGGGDVKLLVALALWLPWQDTYWLVLLSSVAGLVITVIFWLAERRRQFDGKPQIPFGIAIALAGLWVIGERYINQFA